MRGESMKGKSKKSTYSTTFGVDPIFRTFMDDARAAEDYPLPPEVIEPDDPPEFPGSTPKRVDFNERRRIEPRPSICNFRSFDNRKPFVVSVSFSCGSPRLFRYFS